MSTICQYIVRSRAHRFAKLLQRSVFKRQLYSPAPLGLLEFDKQQTRWKEKVAHRKDEFLRRVEGAVDTDSMILMEDVKALLYVADNDTEVSLAFKLLNRYKSQQEKKSFNTYYPLGEHVLKMLYRLGMDEMAFGWFLDEKHNVKPSCQNRECFLLMMDFLYESDRHEDVVSVLSVANTYFDRKYPELVTIALASLYKMNTRNALEDMQTVMQELCTDPVQLTARSALLSSMLAYNQGDVDLMMEVLELPVFTACSGRLISAIPNVKILAYIELGRLEECVDILKDAVMKLQKPANLFFDDVLEKLSTAVKVSGSLELQTMLKTLLRSLTVAGFVFPTNLEGHMLGTIRFKEYDTLINTSNPQQMYKKLKTLSDRFAIKDTNLVS